MQELNGQVAIITGSARGIGRGIATVLAREGARVVIADLDGDASERTAAELRAGGLDARGHATDVTSRSSCDALAAAVLADLGRIDILAANAGIFPSIPLESLDGAEWDRVMNVNAKGALHAIQACLPGMLPRGYGRIVLTSSITGPITGQPGYALYGATKAAMLGMMRSAAIELAVRGVTVNAVMPGNVATEGFAEAGDGHHDRMLASIPLGYLAEPEDIAWAVRFLASPEARYITGQTLIVDGGQVLPEA